MANMRNRIVHEYFGVGLSIVWETIRQDIPDLKRQIDAIISSLKNNDLSSNSAEMAPDRVGVFRAIIIIVRWNNERVK